MWGSSVELLSVSYRSFGREGEKCLWSAGSNKQGGMDMGRKIRDVG